ncbi:MAG: DEAD/DEAH box helicase, partial [Acidimicrobiales bacterium]
MAPVPACPPAEAVLDVARTLPQLRTHQVSELRGIGPRKVEALAELEILTILDLLTHYPRRYIDRTHQTTIDQLTVGAEAVLLVTVRRASTRRSRTGKSITEVDVTDESHKTLRISFFNQPWRSRQLAAGAEVLLYGKVAVYRGHLTLGNPSVDLVGDQTGRVVPIYPQSEKSGLTTREIGTWVREALERAGDLTDPLPESWRDELDLVGRTWAMRQIHEPESLGAAAAARKRLAFDELLRLQVLLVQRKRTVERESVGIRHATAGGLVAAFIDRLPFALTAAQRRAIDEIDEDLGGPHPMHRLLQGDVGSGKTLVAVAAMLTGVQGGHQGALLAPTEVLADQHDTNVRGLVSGLTIETREGGNLF